MKSRARKVAITWVRGHWRSAPMRAECRQGIGWVSGLVKV